MREVTLRLPSAAVEDVLDRLLPLVPGGVREIADGDEIELRMRGTELPGRDELTRAAAGCAHTVSEREVSDDWRERRLADYELAPIGGRLAVRPTWAPPAPAGMLEIVLAESAAFGAGTHPTTRACLELLLDQRSGATFADLGCGSGVLAILAAKLGWDRVIAIDVQAASVEAAIGNARLNGVEIEAWAGDLFAAPPPDADGIAANVPLQLHTRLAETIGQVPRLALLSGFGPTDAGAIVAAYAARGLGERVRIERDGWVVAVLSRD